MRGIHRTGRDPEQCRKTAIHQANLFHRDTLRDDINAVDRHRLRNLAFVYGGATVAIQAGVLPFGRALVRDALRTLVPGAPPRIDRFADARRVVAAAVRELPTATTVARNGSRQVVGYRDDNASKYVFRAADFRELFNGDRVQYKRAISWLESSGRLEARDARSDAARSDRIEERTVKWPDGEIVRSIVLRMTRTGR